MNRDDFIDEVGRELELLTAGQTLEAEFKAVIGSVYDTRYAFLARKRIAYFPKNDIPDEIVNPLSIYIAAYCAGRLLDAQGKAEKMANVSQALRDMREVAGEKSVRGKVYAGYF